MSGVKISQLPPASAANDTDQLEVNQSGTSRSVTVGQVSAAFATDSLRFKLVRDFDITGDGVTDDSAGWAALCTFAAANPGYRYVGVPGDIYVIDTTPINFPAGTQLTLAGTSFTFTGNSTSSSARLVFDTGCVVDVLDVLLPAGALTYRMVWMGAFCRFGTIRIVATDQIANAVDQIAGALTVSNVSGWSVDRVYVRNFDSPVFIRGTVTLADPEAEATVCRDWRIGSVEVESYLRGLNVFGSVRGEVGSLFAHTKSPNATTSAGHNGLRMGQCRDMRFGPTIIEDSGEHGIYVAGGYGSESTWGSENYVFSTVVTRRTGQCGFKCDNSGTEVGPGAEVGERGVLHGLTIASLSCFDCSWQNAAGDNEEYLRLNNVVSVNIGAFYGDQIEGDSAYKGIYITGSQRISIGSAYIDRCSAGGIYIATNSTATHPIPSDITIGSLSTGTTIGGPLIEIACPGDAVGGISITGINAQDCTSVLSATVGSWSTPVVFEGAVSSHTSLFAGSNAKDAAVHYEFRLADGGVVRSLRETFNLFVDLPDNLDYRLATNLPHGFTVTSVTSQCTSGTATATTKVNSTALGGTANAVSSSEQTQAHTTTNVAVAGDNLVVTVSANSSCVGLALTVTGWRSS
jgi:hypothetical protein